MLNARLRRPVIGVLPAWTIYGDEMPDNYSEQILQGMLAQAHASGCDLLLAVGIDRLAWPVAGPDTDFVPIGPWNTDGLIVFTPLKDEKRSAYIQQVQAEGHPVFFIATGEHGPAIQMDNETGIRQAIAHLAGHGHQSIAFIAGDPEDPGDTVKRLAAYRTALAECGLDYHPCLVAYGHHIEEGGYTAMKQILDSGVPFSAVQASNDASAVGALLALRDAGIQVPDQVALIGFDDQPDATAQVPSLTSVHTPLAEMGAKAIECMFARIVSGEPLESIILPTRITYRQSCGCLPDAILHASKPASGLQPVDIQKPLEQAEIIARLNQAMLLSGANQSKHGLAQPYARIVMALIESVQRGETACFDQELLAFLRSIEQVNGDFRPFQDAISALRLEILSMAQIWPGIGSLGFIEDLFQRTRVAISESLQWVNFRSHYTRENYSYKLSMLTARLSSCLDTRQLVEILEADMPKIGIPHARLILFEPLNGDPVAGSRWVIPAPETDLLMEQFVSHQFPPPQLYPAGETLSLALVALAFQNEPLGYIAFDSAKIASLPPITRQISATLKAAQLHAKVVDLSLNDELTGVYNRRYLELFLRKEIARHQRFQHNLSIIMVDIDDFKIYNDTFGHLAGDDALKIVAQCLQYRLRETDIVARYGGDEFILVLAETDSNGALSAAAHIRSSITDQIRLMRPVTLSMGIATMIEGEVSLNQLIARADEALYEAKFGGKDHVSLAKPPNTGFIL
jgi:diguanylate cyclase (GGDEF)-like protein